MRFTSSIVALAVPALAAAQAYGPPPGPVAGPTSTSSSVATAPTAPPDTTGFVNVGVTISSELFSF